MSQPLLGCLSSLDLEPVSLSCLRLDLLAGDLVLDLLDLGDLEDLLWELQSVSLMLVVLLCLWEL